MRCLPEGTWVVLDEAYGEFAAQGSLPRTKALLEERRNLVAVRTFSKAWGLAGRESLRPRPAELLRFSPRERALRRQPYGPCGSLGWPCETPRSPSGKPWTPSFSERERVSLDPSRPWAIRVLPSITTSSSHPSPWTPRSDPRISWKGRHRPPLRGLGLFPRSIPVYRGNGGRKFLLPGSLVTVLRKKNGNGMKRRSARPKGRRVFKEVTRTYPDGTISVERPGSLKYVAAGW